MEAGTEAAREGGQSASEAYFGELADRNNCLYSVHPSSAAYASIESDLRPEGEWTMVPAAATASDQRLDFASRLNTPISTRPSYGTFRTLFAGLEQDYAPSLGRGSYSRFDTPNLAHPEFHIGLAPEEGGYAEEPLSGTAERYAPSSEYGCAAPHRGYDPPGWPSVSMTLGNGGQYGAPAASVEWGTLEHPRRSYAPQWDSADAAVDLSRAPSQSRLPPPVVGGAAGNYATPPSTASTRVQTATILPPLPAAPPLSAASYSLLPAGPTLPSFASMSTGLPAGDAEQAHDYSYFGYIPMASVSPAVPTVRETGGMAPAWAAPLPASPVATRRDHHGSAGGVDDPDSYTIKPEPESSPELPPSPTNRFSESAAHPAEHPAPKSKRPIATSSRAEGCVSCPVDNAVVPEDWNGGSPSPLFSSSNDDEGDAASPDWTPVSSSPRGRSTLRQKGPPVRSRRLSSPLPSRPPRRRPSNSRPAFPSDSPPEPRISPITGQPVKPISKRLFPPRDAHKRKFACDFEGCDKTCKPLEDASAVQAPLAKQDNRCKEGD